MIVHTVMLVEDEHLIRLMVSDFLQDAGYDVIEAVHAEAALEILAVRAEGIHILFTDIHMPGEMDGLALAHHARGKWPWIRTLLSSGRGRPEPSDLPEGSRFLPKPYMPHAIISHVQEMLAHD